MASDKGASSPPPTDLHERELKLVDATARRGADWFRIGKTRYAPLYFSQDDGWRFSRPDMPGVLYIGESAETCFWEVFWDDLANRKPVDRKLDSGKVDERSLWVVTIPPGIRVVDTFSAAALQDMSAHTGTFSGPYVICQAWAKALREHPQKPHGILYESARNRGTACLALFEESCKPLAFQFTGMSALRDSVALATSLAKYGIL